MDKLARLAEPSQKFMEEYNAQRKAILAEIKLPEYTSDKFERVALTDTMPNELYDYVTLEEWREILLANNIIIDSPKLKGYVLCRRDFQPHSLKQREELIQNPTIQKLVKGKLYIP